MLRNRLINGERLFREKLEVPVRIIVADVPFQMTTQACDRGYWFRPHHHRAEERDKLLKKQILGGVMCVLAQVARYQPRLLFGSGQGAVMVGMMGMPRVVELAIRLRAPIDREIRDYRQSWSRVGGLIAIEPQLAPDCSRHPVSELIAAVKEIVMVQSRGVHRAVVQTSQHAYNAQAVFNQEFAAKIGSNLYRDAELSKALREIATVILKEAPLHFEDDAGGSGACAVCHLRGTMTVCRKCGLLVHMACAPPALPGREIVCPRCKALDTGDIEEAGVDGTMARRYDIRSKVYEKPHGSAASPSPASLTVPAPFYGAGVGERESAVMKLKAEKEEVRDRANMREFWKKTLGPRRDPGDKSLCRLDRRPTNEEAEMAGFLDARSWYLHSSRERGIDAMVGEQNFDSLPTSEPPESPHDDGHADVWAKSRGEKLGGDEVINGILSREIERVAAVHGHGVMQDPVYPEPVRPSSADEAKIRRLGDQIRERKLMLKSLGWTGRQIHDDETIQRFAQQLAAVATEMGSASEAEPKVQKAYGNDSACLITSQQSELGGVTASFNDAVAASNCCGQNDWLCEDEPDAHTRQLQFALGLAHPYNLSDVESAAHDKVATARDRIHEQIKQQWLDSASLHTNEPLDLPLPDGAVTKTEVPEALNSAPVEQIRLRNRYGSESVQYKAQASTRSACGAGEG